MNIIKREELAPFAFGTLARFRYRLIKPCFVCGKTENIILWECFTWDIIEHITQLFIVLEFHERNGCIVTMHDNVAMLNTTNGFKFVEQVLVEIHIITIK